MKRWLVVVGAACGSPHPPTTIVSALAGEQPEPGATVISSHPDGTVVDQVTADGVGRAELTSAELITVVFVRAATTAIVTTPPLPTGELAVHGPPRDPAPGVIVGALAVAPQAPLAADHYDLELGCTTVTVTALPVSLDVAARCLGSDVNLDVLVRGYAGAQLVGYAAGRVPLVDGAAMFAPASWQTTGPTVPIALDGVAPALDWILWVDHLAFDAHPLGDHGQLWTGLAVDAAAVHAVLATQTTTRELPSAPTALAFAAADFLPPVAPGLAIVDPTKLAVGWTAVDPGADALDLHVEWAATTWDAVLPPDADRVTFPAFTMPGAISVASLSYVDSSEVVGFAALAAGGVYAGTAAPLPRDGELRVTTAVP